MWLVLLLLNGVIAHAGTITETPMVMCSAQEGGLSGELNLSEHGQSSLSISQGSERYFCHLSISVFEFAPGATLPQTTFEFKRKSCVPELPASLEKRLFSEILMKFQRGEKGGLLQWLRNEAVSTCLRQKFDTQEVERVHYRWKHQSWPFK